MKISITRNPIVIATGLIAVGCGGFGGSSSSDGSLTTRAQTVVPVAVPMDAAHINPSDLADYATYGYSAWSIGAGENQGRKFDLMPAGYRGAAHTAELLSYFTLSDAHITDKESPAQAPVLGWFAPYQAGMLYSASYSPVSLSTTQVLDAAIRTINAANRQAHFSFGMSMGDVANNTQYNELRWFIDVMDGKPITPSSGAHAGAGSIDYQMPFQAAGLDRSIPWYEVIGNHDQFWMGGGYVTDKLRNAMVGSEVLNVSPNFLAANGTAGTGLYVGVVDGSTPYGTVVGAGPASQFATAPSVVADPNRHSVTTPASTTTGYISEFFNTTSSPVGHGFNLANTGNTAACYTFEPKASLPLKVIVLDDTCKTTNSGADSHYYSSGWIDAPRMTWLTNELQKGQDAGQLMIVACHIPIEPQTDLLNTTPFPQWHAQSNPSESQVISTLHQYPNLILLMAGHLHRNVVTPQPSPDKTHPEFGFWEVETPSLREFPRQFRTFAIHRNNDNSISIVTTDVDPVVQPGSVAAKSLGYAIGAYRLFGGTTMTDTTSHTYNAELFKLLTPAMQRKIAGYRG